MKFVRRYRPGAEAQLAALALLLGLDVPVLAGVVEDRVRDENLFVGRPAPEEGAIPDDLEGRAP